MHLALSASTPISEVKDAIIDVIESDGFVEGNIGAKRGEFLVRELWKYGEGLIVAREDGYFVVDGGKVCQDCLR